MTFDDGPWPAKTPAVLKVLADECLKATFSRSVSTRVASGNHKKVIDAGRRSAPHLVAPGSCAESYERI